MTESAVYLQPAFILQHRPYRETSLLLEVFTRDFGVIPMLAKGVRKEKSRLAGVLLPFALLHVSYLDKQELKILTHAEFISHYPLQKLGLYCGFYVNELLQAFLYKHDPHPGLFACYMACLGDLHTSSAIEQTLRYFELAVLQEAGYGVELEFDARHQIIDSQKRYGFSPDAGLLEDGGGPISGITLRLMQDRAELAGPALTEAKQLLRKMLDVHLQGKPLKSRDVLAKIIRYL